jgi:hypothetical protein
MKNRKFLIAMLVVIILGYVSIVKGVTLKLEKKIQIKEDKKAMILSFAQFTIGKNDEIILPDVKTSDIKIFNSKGHYLYSIGRKGYGPGEFISPYACFGNKTSLWISDFRSLKITQLNLVNNKFKYFKEIKLLSFCTDLKVINDTIYIAGYINATTSDYSFYSKSLKNTRSTKYLIPRSLKYGKNLYNKDHYSMYNLFGSFDIYKNYVFFVWPADLRIIRLDLTNKSTMIFGKRTNNYIKPFVSEKLIKAYKKRNAKLIDQTKKSVSFIAGVFASHKYLGLIYRGIYCESTNNYPVYVQFYTHDGKFIKESVLDKAFALTNIAKQFYFSLQKSKLYYLNIIENEDDYDYEILVYKLK